MKTFRKTLWLGFAAALLGHALGQGLTYTFDGATLTGPERFAGTGYTELTVRNRADEGYDLSLMRLGEGKTVDDYRAAMAALAAAYGGDGDVPAAHRAVREVVTIIGGAAAEAGEAPQVGVLLEVGDYVLDGSCESCPPGQQISAFTVADGPRAAAPPPDRTVEMHDFHFMGLPAELSAGSELWEIANVGEENHFFSVFRLAEGKTVADLEAFLGGPDYRGEPPPAEYGSEALSSAYLTGPVRYYQTVSLPPGRYVVLCPVLHPGSGRPHFDLGMIQPLTVN